MNNIKAVLFDLDGTLADTAADLNSALNQLLIEENLAPLPLEKIKPIVGGGSRSLIEFGLKISAQDPRYPELRKRFFANYEKYLTQQTTFFTGITEVLNFLDQEKIIWGIITNKPARFTQPLLEHLKLSSRAHCVISGDTLQHQKPHPAQLEYACEVLQLQPENCIYIGDMLTDVMASRAANMPALVALYGYIPADQDPTEWQADGYLKRATDLIGWLT